MKIYFASSASNWKQVRYYIELAKNLGNEITFDWTHMVENEPMDGDRQKAYESAAHNDRIGVYDCDLLINIWTQNQCGAHLETGGAIWLGKPVWIAAKNTDEIRFSVFWELPQVTLMTMETMERLLGSPQKERTA